MKIKYVLHLLLTWALLMCCAACGVRSKSPEAFLAQHAISPVVNEILTVCTGFGCTRTGRVRLTDESFFGLDEVFGAPVETPSAERGAVARAVAYMEQVVGNAVGTDGDLARNQRNRKASGQLDCIAETVNTTIYLLLLEQRGMLAFHRVAAPAHRGATVFTAHNTAVIQETDGSEYAVDSWFHDNGRPPEIVNLSAWLDDFQPVAKTGRAGPVGAEAGMENDDGV